MKPEYENFLEDEKEIFKIENDKQADWAIRKIKEINEEEIRVRTLLKEQQHELKQKEKSLTERAENDRNYFLSLLDAYRREEDLNLKESKTQFSYKLASGDLVIKKAKKDFNRTSNAGLIEHYKGTNFVVEEPKLKWGELKKHLKIESDGTIIDLLTGEILNIDGLDVKDIKEEIIIK